MGSDTSELVSLPGTDGTEAWECALRNGNLDHFDAEHMREAAGTVSRDRAAVSHPPGRA